MKKAWILGAFLLAGQTLAQETGTPLPSASTSTAPASSDSTPVAAPVKWSFAGVPWDAWFKNNAMVTDKTDYVHFFWNAQDVKANFEVKDKKRRMEEAALQLVSKLYPAAAKADAVKVDIVYVLERDEYGLPRWDTLQQVAHFEFLKSKALKTAEGKKEPSAKALDKIFDKAEILN